MGASRSLKSIVEEAAERRDTIEPLETASFLPGLGEAEISALEAQRPLPTELKELLRYCGGIEDAGEFDRLHFFGVEGAPVFESVFPTAVPIAVDGSGNGWLVDVDPETGAWGTCFYLSHDPGAVVIVASSPAEFLVDSLLDSKRSQDSNSADEIWENDAWLRDLQDADIQADEELVAFSESISAEHRIADLRGREPGSGFALKAGRQVWRRGNEWVFAVEWRPRLSLVDRLKAMVGAMFR